MILLGRNNGVSLIELMISVIFIVVISVTIALFFPRISRSSQYDRQRTVATHLASAKMESILKQPYGYIAPTPSTSFPVSISNCDCNDPSMDMTLLVPPTPPPPPTVNQSDVVTSEQEFITYTRYVCINKVRRTTATTWVSICDPTGNQDTGMRAVRVQVRWNPGNGEKGVVDSQSVATPS